MVYKFSPDLPPLMKDGSIFNLDPETLKGPLIGEAKPETTITTFDSQHDHYQWRKTYDIKHYQQWSLMMPVHHYASTQAVQVVETTGYDVTEKAAMESNLSATAGGSGFGLSAEVTASLKLSEETTKTWTASTATTTSMTFEALTTYAFWVLHDVIEARVVTQTNYEYKGDPPPDPDWKQEGVALVTYLHVPIKEYEDKLPDPQAVYMAAFNSHHARVAVARRRA
jgi:hypothetical protein